jgi:hypothetical protein
VTDAASPVDHRAPRSVLQNARGARPSFYGTAEYAKPLMSDLATPIVLSRLRSSLGKIYWRSSIVGRLGVCFVCLSDRDQDPIARRYNQIAMSAVVTAALASGLKNARRHPF